MKLEALYGFAEITRSVLSVDCGLLRVVALLFVVGSWEFHDHQHSDAYVRCATCMLNSPSC